MNEFLITLATVGIMLAYAVPGYILIKVRAVKADSISAFSKLLMYVCQPFLTLYSFNRAEFTPELGVNLLIFFALVTALQLAFIGIMCLIFRKKRDDVRYRVASIASVLSNCSFLGVPILEALFPDWANAPAYSMVFFFSMSLLGWTLVSAVYTLDRRYISVKKALLNPATISLVIALPFFLTGFKISAENGWFLGQLENMITVLARMTTPLCMLIMGMRLATVPVKSIFTEPLAYLCIAIKQIVFPLVTLGLLTLMGLDEELQWCMYVMCACPIASGACGSGPRNGGKMRASGHDILRSHPSAALSSDRRLAFLHNFLFTVAHKLRLICAFYIDCNFFAKKFFILH